MKTKLFGEDIFRTDVAGAAAYAKLAHPSPDFRFFLVERVFADKSLRFRGAIFKRDRASGELTRTMVKGSGQEVAVVQSDLDSTMAANPLPPAHPKDAWLTDLAAGVTYEQCIAAGWTDALLIEHKMMAA
jgi:hypothetical protein